MKAALALLIAMIVVPLWDWASITRMGSFAPNCDFRYWPLSKLRAASVALLLIAFTVIGTFAISGPVDPPIWAVWLAGMALVTWGIVGFVDVMAQNRKGYRAPPPPPRYSEPCF